MLPDLKDKEDVFDYLQTHSLGDLRGLISPAEEWKPKQLTIYELDKHISSFKGKELIGHRTKIPTLNKLTRGIRDIVCFYGEGGAGKSTLTLNLAIDFALQGLDILYFDLELGTGLLTRLVCNICNVTESDLLHGVEHDLDTGKIIKVLDHLYIEQNESAITPQNIETGINLFEHKNPIIIIDSLQTLEDIKPTKFESIEGWLNILKQVWIKYNPLIIFTSEVNVQDKPKWGEKVRHTANLLIHMKKDKDSEDKVSLYIEKSNYAPTNKTIPLHFDYLHWNLGEREEEITAYKVRASREDKEKADYGEAVVWSR